jgi:hypothetical protein
VIVLYYAAEAIRPFRREPGKPYALWQETVRGFAGLNEGDFHAE